ncbi:MAG: hypothetical protein AB7O96_01040 [Pseudobdellovibrionaceae bacterium]
MHLSEIVNNVRAEVQPASNIDSLIKKWANRAQKRFLIEAKHNFSWLVLDKLTFTTNAGEGDVTLSPIVDVGKTIVITDRVSPRKITVITREQFYNSVPNPTTNQGTPKVAFLSGYSPVQFQPSSDSQLSIVSSSTSDVTSVVRIEGLNASGVPIGEDVILNGTTPVSTVNSYSRILGRSINAFLTGVLTITSNAGAVTNAVIGPRQRQALYPKITLWPTPSTAQTFYYDAYSVVTELTGDNDFSIIPEDYHEAIESFCCYRGFNLKKDPVMAQSSLANFKDVVMLAVADDKGPRKSIQMESRPSIYSDFSNLPGNYPRGV